MATKKDSAKTEAPKSPVTKDQFRKGAKPVPIVFDGGATLVAAPKEFATGSLGWYAGEKITMSIDGVAVRVQVGINMTIIGSKEAK